MEYRTGVKLSLILFNRGQQRPDPRVAAEKREYKINVVFYLVYIGKIYVF